MHKTFITDDNQAPQIQDFKEKEKIIWNSFQNAFK